MTPSACWNMAEEAGESALETIAEVLLRHGVEFIVVGGQAELLMGSPRVTYDINLCSRRSKDNLRRLAAALRKSSQLSETPPPTDQRTSSRAPFPANPEIDPRGPAAGDPIFVGMYLLMRTGDLIPTDVVRGSHWNGDPQKARISVRDYSKPNNGMTSIVGRRVVREPTRSF